MGAGEAGGVRYRVAKVLIDGKERPDLLEAGRFVFEAIEGDHDVEVVLEALPSDAIKDGTETKGEDQAPAQVIRRGMERILAARAEIRAATRMRFPGWLKLVTS